MRFFNQMNRLACLSLSAWLLVACTTDQLPNNLQMLGSIHNSIQSDSTFAIIVPIYNGSNQPSLSTHLQISLHYYTDSNGGSLHCSEFAKPTECVQPLKCKREVTIPVPSLAGHAHWETPTVPISEKTGPCGCTKGHCDGVAELRLVVNDPPAPRYWALCNTYLTYSWRADGQNGGVVGYKDNKNDCYRDI
jgi:hypothetical protein